MAYGFNEDKTKASIEEIAADSMADKVDKVAGKGLSDNNYTNADKAIVDGFTAQLNNKVTKESGKGLSTNDFTTAIKTKVDERAYNVFGSGVVLAQNNSASYDSYTCPHDGYLSFTVNSGSYSPGCTINGGFYVDYNPDYIPAIVLFVKKGTVLTELWAPSNTAITYYPFTSYK